MPPLDLVARVPQRTTYHGFGAWDRRGRSRDIIHEADMHRYEEDFSQRVHEKLLTSRRRRKLWKSLQRVQPPLFPNPVHPLTPPSVDKRTGQSVAIKIIDVENAEDEVDDIIQEISILSGLNSPYVTKYYGSYLKGSDLWIIMEYCSGGSCGDLLKPGLIPEDYITIIVRELLMGLEYLHNDNKLHRDIKGSNSMWKITRVIC